MSAQPSTFTNATKFVLRTLAASSVLFVLDMALHPSWGLLASWDVMVSALLVCTVLCWITERSQASGAELVATLAGFYFVLASVSNIPEGVLFDVIKVGQAPQLMVQQFGVALVIAVVIAVLFGRAKTKPVHAPVWRSDMSISRPDLAACGIHRNLHDLLHRCRDADLSIGQGLLPSSEHARTPSDAFDDSATGRHPGCCRGFGVAQHPKPQRRAPHSRYSVSRDLRDLSYDPA